jgi:hypothetical protein
MNRRLFWGLASLILLAVAIVATWMVIDAKRRGRESAERAERADDLLSVGRKADHHLAASQELKLWKNLSHEASKWLENEARTSLDEVTDANLSVRAKYAGHMKPLEDVDPEILAKYDRIKDLFPIEVERRVKANRSSLDADLSAAREKNPTLREFDPQYQEIVLKWVKRTRAENRDYIDQQYQLIRQK